MYLLEESRIQAFADWLVINEKSPATISKYTHDVRLFRDYMSEVSDEISKEHVITFKEMLKAKYKISSANSILAAVNIFLKYSGLNECVVRAFRLQRESFRETNRDLTKEEYLRLIQTAKKNGRDRLALIMETICATGIRVGELQFITFQAAANGRAEISCKGKNRSVLIPSRLCKKLKAYAKARNIMSGCVFITRSGRVMDRSNILHEMKSLCEEAGVEKGKTFPHNLRHLFAVTYYRLEKDLAHLADILGHSNVNTTRIYTACSSAEQLKAITRMGFVT